MPLRRDRSAGKISLSTLVMLLVLGAGGYWLWRFFPVYFDSWKVDNILDDCVTRAYALQRKSPSDRASGEHALVGEMRDRIRALGIADPELIVTLNHEGDKAVARADYTVLVRHPVVNKTTVMVMHRKAATSTARVNWD